MALKRKAKAQSKTADTSTRRTRARDGADLKRVTVWLSSDTVRSLRHYAADHDVSLAGAIEKLTAAHTSYK